MPFHVIASFGSEGKKSVLFKDLNENSLNKLFVRPYKYGKNLLVGSEIKPTADISFVKVISTDKSHKETIDTEIRKAENSGDATEKALTFMYCMNDESIESYGMDETSRYISAPPGESTIIGRVLNNQWTISIGAGSVLAIIGAFIVRSIGPS